MDIDKMSINAMDEYIRNMDDEEMMRMDHDLQLDLPRIPQANTDSLNFMKRKQARNPDLAKVDYSPSKPPPKAIRHEPVP